MEKLKHFILLLPRLISEWFNDISKYRARFKRKEGLSRAGMNGDNRLFQFRYWITSLPLQAISLIKSPSIQMLNGADTLLNRGQPVIIMYDHVEDNIYKNETSHNILDLAGASLIASENHPEEIYDATIFFEELDITMDLLRKNIYNLTTEEAITLMAFYRICGRGLLWPREHYKKLYNLYAINLLLKPVFFDYRVVMSLYTLQKLTNDKVWKILYNINSGHTPKEDWEGYAC
jgi:hypothetical protein